MSSALIVVAGFGCGVDETGGEVQVVLVHDVFDPGHRVRRFDCGVVERAAAETAARRAVEDGQYAGAGRGAGAVDGLLAWHPAGGL
jgi:hypothetical protein